MDNSNNMSNRAYPQQLQQPQLPQMEPQALPQTAPSGPAGVNPPVAPAQNEAPRKSRMPIIFAAIVAAIVVVVGVVIVIAMISNKQPDSDGGQKTAKLEPIETVIDQDTDKYSRVDIERNNTLMRLVSAMESYQTDNGGLLPFGEDMRIGEYLIKRYIDTTCEVELDTGEEARFNACSEEFSDFSDKGPFAVVYKGSVEKLDFADDLADVSGEIKEEKTFYAYSFAYCGGNGKLLKGKDEYSVAVLGKLTTGEIICQDNH